MNEDSSTKRILARMGYMLGRYIYLCDAIDDLPRDIKDGSFNPLKGVDDTEQIAGMLRLSIAEVGSAYSLLSPHYFVEILDNIIYLGLLNQANRLLEGRNSHNGQPI
jgi:hypothetical protein